MKNLKIILPIEETPAIISKNIHAIRLIIYNFFLKLKKKDKPLLIMYFQNIKIFLLFALAV